MRNSLLGLVTMVSLAITSSGCFTTGGILLDLRARDRHPTAHSSRESGAVFTLAGVLLDVAAIGITASVLAYEGAPEAGAMARTLP